MRKLLWTRGIPGSGKSRALRECGLEDFTLSPDAMRLMLGGPEMAAGGSMTVPQTREKRLWRMVHALLEERMARGETVAVDATHARSEDMEGYAEMAGRHRYSMACLDLTGVEFEVAMRRNMERPEVHRVPADSVQRISGNMAKGAVPAGVAVIPVTRKDTWRNKVEEWLSAPSLALDLDGAARVVHVGSLHGGAAALVALVESMGGIRGDDHWIFSGDSCGRGPGSGATVRWLLENAAGRANVSMLWGGDEDRLHAMATGEDPGHAAFSATAVPSLAASGLGRDELDAYCGSLADMVSYRRGGMTVWATHAGLPGPAGRAWMVPSSQCRGGAGRWEDAVDAQWSRNAPEGFVQVHSARNPGRLPLDPAAASVNLAASPGEGLRVAVHGNRGFSAAPSGKPCPAPHTDPGMPTGGAAPASCVPAWATRGEAHLAVMPPDALEAMRSHRNVKMRRSKLYPGIVSFNFDKHVFHSRLWDDIVVKARGLFADDGTWEIVARSYDKFFNVGEMEDTSLLSMSENLVFPVTGWVKENGFLGILGYDPRSESLFATSKSAPDSPFAGWFREILADTVPEAVCHELGLFLRDTGSSMAFEVIDPVRDPHMIEYPEPGLVLLDVFRRSMEFENMPPDGLAAVADRYGLTAKRRAMVFPDWASLEEWHRAASCDMSVELEGYVLEDARGFQAKVKLPYYAFWKWCRTIKDAVARDMAGTGARVPRAPLAQVAENRGLGFLAGEAERFRDWCLAQPATALKSDIITLRRSFAAGTPAPGPGPG